MEHASFLSFYVTLYRCASGHDFVAINVPVGGAYLLSESFGRLFSALSVPNGGNTVVMIVEGRETLSDQCALYPRFSGLI